MENIKEDFINALLADATYALDRNNINGYTGSDLADLLSGRMTPELAKYIGENFTVVTHIESGDVLGSGFDATVWKRNSDNKYYISMQGTTGLEDFITDIALTTTGSAGRQIYDMVNWWLKNTTPAGVEAPQIGLSGDIISSAAPVMGTGVLTGIGSISVTGHSLGGHLATAFARLFGGYPLVIDDVTTFNSAGFTITSEPVFSAIEQLLPSGTSAGQFPSQNEQNNIYSANGLSATTREWLNIHYGRRIEVSNEESSDQISNHYMYKITDLLALGNSLAMLDPDLDINGLNNLLNNSSHKTESSIEYALDAVRNIMGLYFDVPTPVGDDAGSATSRVVYHQLLTQLQDSDIFESLKGHITLSPDFSSSSARTNFGEFISLHLGLPFVISTNDSTATAALQTVHGDEYTDWLADQSRPNAERVYTDEYLQDRAAYLHLLSIRNALDNDEAQSHGAYHAKDLANPEGDVDGWEFSDYWTIFGEETADTTGLTGGDYSDRLYGLGGNDILMGGKGDDHLEGGKGEDTYVFDAANPWGIDTIIDGAHTNGGEIQILNSAFASCQFKATDASGLVYEDKNHPEFTLNYNETSKTLSIVYRPPGETPSVIRVHGFHKTSNNFGLTLNDFTAPTAPVQAGDATLDFPSIATSSNGEFSYYDEGILQVGNGHVDFGADNEWNTREEREDEEFDPDNADEGIIGNQIDNVVSDAIVYNASQYYFEEFVEDWYHGAATSFLFQGGAGNDVLTGSGWRETQEALSENGFITFIDNKGMKSYSSEDENSDAWIGDLLYGNDGDDLIRGDGAAEAGDNDFLVGGKGNDQLFGEDGNDVLWGADYWQGSLATNYLSTHIWYLNQGTSQQEQISTAAGALFNNLEYIETVNETNFLDGGAGNDNLIGASFKDVLIGGDGHDLILGGAGQDLVSGGNDKDIIYGDSSGALTTYSVGNSAEAFTAYVADHLAPDILPSDADQHAYFFSKAGGLIEQRYDATLHAEGATDPAKRREYNALFDDVLDGGAGDDVIFGEIGNDVIFGGADKDFLHGDRSFNSASAIAQFGSLYQQLSSRYHGDDVIDGGEGSDELVGGGGNDVLFGGDEAAVENETNDMIFGDMGLGLYDDVAADEEEWWGNDKLYGGKGRDVLVGEGGDDELSGGEDSDSLHGDWHLTQAVSEGDRETHGGNDTLDGGNGADFLYGGAGNDTLIGSKGNDSLKGEWGNDTYIVRAGDGQDVLEDIEGTNTLKLIGTWLNANGRPQIEQTGNTVKLFTSADGSHFISMNIGTWNTLRDHIEYSDGSTLDTHDIEINIDPSDSNPGVVISPVAGDRYTVHNNEENYAVINVLGDLVHEGVAVTVDINHDEGSALITIPGETEADNVTIHIDDWESFHALKYGSITEGSTSYLFTEDKGFMINASSNMTDDVVLLGKSGNDVITGGEADEVLVGGEGNDTYVLALTPLTSTPLSEREVDTIRDDRGANILQLSGTGVRVTLRADQSDTVGEEQDLSLPFGVRVFNGDTDSYTQMDRNSWESMSFKDVADNAFDLRVSVLGVAGFLYEVTADTVTKIRTLQLADGMELEDCLAYRSGDDLLLTSDANPGTAVRMIDFFGEQPAGWSWQIIDGVASEPLDLSVNGWLDEHLVNAGDSFVPMDMELFKLFQRFEMQAIGQSGKSLRTGKDFSFRAGDEYDGQGEPGCIDQYSFQMIEASLVAAELEPGDAGYADAATGVLSHTVKKTVKHWVEDYQTYSGQMGLPDGRGGFYWIQFPSVTVNTGGHWETSTITDAFVDVNRTVTLQEIVGDAADDTVMAVHGFRGTVDLGDGDNVVDLSSHLPEETHDPSRWAPMTGLGAFIQSGSGDDTLIATGANDVISAGGGYNIVDGGAGSDSYLVALEADSITCIQDTSFSANNETNTISFGDGIDPADLAWIEIHVNDELKAIQFQKIIGDNNGQPIYGTGTLVVMTGNAGEWGDAGLGDTGIQLFRFADGNAYTLEELIGTGGLIAEQMLPVSEWGRLVERILAEGYGEVDWFPDHAIRLPASLTSTDIFIERDGDNVLLRRWDNNESIIRITSESGPCTIQFTDGSEEVWEIDNVTTPVEDYAFTIATNNSESIGLGDAFLIDPALLVQNDVVGSSEHGWEVVAVRAMGDCAYYFGDFWGQTIFAAMLSELDENETMTGEFEYLIRERDGNGGHTGPAYGGTFSIKFDASGTITGSELDDIIDGSDAVSLTIIADQGNDIIYGSTGADTVIHSTGDGHDLLIMQQGNGYEEDSLVLINSSASADDVAFEQDQQDLLVKLNNEVIRIKDFTWQAAGAINKIQLFASQADYDANLPVAEWGLDGSANPLLDLNNNWSLQTSDTRDDVITVWEGSGNEKFNGQGGDDYLNTRDGDDTLAGGADDDTLIGGSGSDTYVFAVGDGSDTIYNADPDASSSDEDVLEIAGITDYRDLWFSESNDDLVVRVLGTSDQITIKNWFAADNNSWDPNKLDAFRAIDTSNNTFVLESDPFNQLLAAMATFQHIHGLPTTAPATLDDGNNGNAYSSWIAVV